MITTNRVKLPDYLQKQTLKSTKTVKAKTEKKRVNRPKVYAVDFDGTLSFGRYPNIGNPNIELIEALKYLRDCGHKVILWTTRMDDRLTEAVEWCGSFGLEFDCVNDNLPEIIEVYGNPRKVAADLYISSRSFPYWLKGVKEEICKLLQDT